MSNSDHMFRGVYEEHYPDGSHYIETFNMNEHVGRALAKDLQRWLYDIDQKKHHEPLSNGPECQDKLKWQPTFEFRWYKPKKGKKSLQQKYIANGKDYPAEKWFDVPLVRELG